MSGMQSDRNRYDFSPPPPPLPSSYKNLITGIPLIYLSKLTYYNLMYLHFTCDCQYGGNLMIRRLLCHVM